MPRASKKPKMSARKMAEAYAMRIGTYFGFFAESFFKAVQGSLTQQTLTPVSLEGVDISTSNAIKLRLAEVETVIVPERVIADDVPFALALTGKDVQALNELAQRGVSLQRLMEQAVSTALEPFNLISKRRNRLTGLAFSHNVVGFTAASLGGEISYTMATARFKLRSQSEFAMRLLVTAAGRDRIEGRANESHTQRALFSIIEGAYVCSPQWEPPPPPPLPELAGSLPEQLTASWMQSFFVLNGGALAPRVFGQPVAFQAQLDKTQSLERLAAGGAPVVVVRLIANDQRELEALVLLRPEAERELIRLSKSAEARFLGELFRVLFGDAAGQWQKLSGQDIAWKAQAVGRLSADDMKAVTTRLEGGGVVLKTEAGLDEGTLNWHLALPPHTWHWMMRLTAKGMDHKVGEQPDRDAIFQATGWGAGSVPWKLIFPFFGDRDLQLLVRQLDRLKLTEADLASVGRALSHGDRDRWHEAMPQDLRERVMACRVGPGEAARRQLAVTQVLIDLNAQNRLPEGRLVPWLNLFAEFQWQRRQRLLEAGLPFRHLVYGMDRSSLSRLLYDEKNQVLEEALTWAEFAVLDQVRRAISPGFALRLLDNIAHRRPRTSACTSQGAQLAVYRRADRGRVEGRYLIRRTPAKRLNELIRALDEPR